MFADHNSSRQEFNKQEEKGNMKTINQTMKNTFGHYPEKVLQFGEGNFLRAFADWMIDGANENGAYQGSIVLCQPIAQGQQMKEMINDQDGLYTVVMRGIEDGQPVEKIKPIRSISRCINAYDDYDALMQLAASPDLETVVSNTTEAGISYHEGDKLTDCPPVSFPAKVTAFLYHRYQAFNGDHNRGLLFLPVELIDNNGAELKRIVLKYAHEWNLEPAFIEWVDQDNHFTSTLVDRIVTGYPRDQVAEFEEKLGYKDNLVDTCEVFNLWVIEGDKKWADIMPVHKSCGNVIWTDDVTPYKKRKVRILNGGHTGTVLAAYLSGHDIVLDFMNDPVFKNYLEGLTFGEIIPTLDLPKEELEKFARDVEDRFANPYIRHRLLDISLNSCSKFNARCLPTLLDYISQFDEIPQHLAFAMAAFIRFYKISRNEDGSYTGQREDGTVYPVKDDAAVLEFFAQQWSQCSTAEVARAVLANKDFWSGRDLTEVKGLLDAVSGYLVRMDTVPVEVIAANIENTTPGK